MNIVAATRATLIPDIQGSIIGALSSGGTLTKVGYQPYGENPSLTSGTFNYTAQRFDAETAGSVAQPSGLYYYRARMYSPTWRRFLQPDPSGYAAGPNIFAYTNNDPLNLTDPSGQFANVVVNGSQVTVQLPVQFAGAGATPDRISAVTAAIQQQWSVAFPAGYNVTTTVVAPSAGTPQSQINTITILDKPGVSVTNAVGGNQTTLYTSYPGLAPYSTTDFANTGAHEAGHLLGDNDYYTMTGSNSSVAMPGYENDLMGTIRGSVDQRNVDAILGCAASNCYSPATGTNPNAPPNGVDNSSGEDGK
jgi:RHS repeat-associated protein